MSGRPRLKDVVWERTSGELRVVHDRRDQLLVEDPDGVVAPAASAGRDPVPVKDLRALIARRARAC